MGSVVSLSDHSGRPVGAYAYDAFGRLHGAPTGPADAYRFAGQQAVRAAEDGAGMLYLMGLRFYDASTGRFLSRDPLGPAP